jgi:hypothetical protein
MSWMTAPVGEVRTAMRRGSMGSGRLRAAANRPSFSSLLLQLLEGLLQRALAQRLDDLDRDLVLALRRIDAHRAADEHLHAVLGLNLMRRAAVFQTTARTCAFAVLEREVPVAGGGHGHVRDLALDPDVEELGLEDALQAVGELADRPGAALRLRLLRPGPKSSPFCCSMLPAFYGEQDRRIGPPDRTVRPHDRGV